MPSWRISCGSTMMKSEESRGLLCYLAGHTVRAMPRVLPWHATPACPCFCRMVLDQLRPPEKRAAWGSFDAPPDFRLFRTPAHAFFPPQLHARLEEALARYGARELGCCSVSPITLRSGAAEHVSCTCRAHLVLHPRLQLPAPLPPLMPSPPTHHPPTTTSHPLPPAPQLLRQRLHARLALRRAAGPLCLCAVADAVGGAGLQGRRAGHAAIQHVGNG